MAKKNLHHISCAYAKNYWDWKRGSGQLAIFGVPVIKTVTVGTASSLGSQTLICENLPSHFENCSLRA